MTEWTLTQDQLKELLHYDTETGLFTWLVQYNSRTAVGAIAGHFDDRGYRRITICGRIFRCGRLAFLYMTGKWPSNLIDHKDGDRANDAWNNLREATYGESTHNRYLPVGESKLRGVRPVPSNPHRWEARIAVGYHRVSLGTFDSAEEAHAAYLAASEDLHGEFAPHNRQKGT